MNDSPSRLELLRFTRRVVEQQARAALAQIDGWIAAEEDREAARRRAEERRPPPPEFLIQHGLNPANIDAVHLGDCWAAAQSSERCKPATKEQIVEALQQHIEACIHCRPDTELGF